jgi:hypothetical protein
MNEGTDDFLDSRLTFALVCKGTYEDIQAFKEYISNFDKVNYIYQKTSADKLHICFEKVADD